MENNDQASAKPDDAQKTFMEENPNTSPKSRWRFVKERFQSIVHTVLTVFKKLRIKIRETYANIFKGEADISLWDDIKGAFRHIPLRKRDGGILFAGLILAVYLLSGVYTVEPGEVAVSRIFGKETRQAITEGLHYRFPWPVEAIEKVNVSEIRRVDVGISSSEGSLLFPPQKSPKPPSGIVGHAGHGGKNTVSEASQGPNSPSIFAKNQFFSGDENILEIRMNIQYQIKDASDYLFNINSPDSLVPTAARAAVTEFFGRMRVEDLLTVAKSQIQKRIAYKVQNMLNSYGAGLHIVNVNLKEVSPPKEVAQAFRDVASAKEEREEKVNKAQGYWNTVIPEARGKAHQMISGAQGYRAQVINQSRGDAQKFSTMLNEYRKAKTVTEYRLYLETIETVLSKAKKFIIDSKEERVNFKFVN